MIYARDKGRMCNNILQFGHVWSLAREHGRKAISMRFAYKYPYFRISTYPGHNFFRYAFAKYAAKLGFIPTVSFDTPGEDCGARTAEILGRRNVMVEGWEVRYYDLFLKHLDEIREMFSFTSSVEKRAENVMSQHPAAVRIGLHIRRGDYATWQNGRYFFYDRQYISVARKLAGRFAGKRIAFFICGNDPHLDKEAYRRELKGADVVFPEGNPGEDLCLLSKCDVLAGPPSTFSLVASMYRDVPLMWIKNPSEEITDTSFGKFEQLFQKII